MDPQRPEAWSELGCLMMDYRRFSEAEGCFRHVLGQHTEAETCDSTQEAVNSLEEIAAARPNWARGRFSLGCAYEHLGDLERAREQLGEALRIDPERLAAVQALFARMYWREEKW